VPDASEYRLGVRHDGPCPAVRREVVSSAACAAPPGPTRARLGPSAGHVAHAEARPLAPAVGTAVPPAEPAEPAMQAYVTSITE
jgi:hypothetical protein